MEREIKKNTIRQVHYGHYIYVEAGQWNVFDPDGKWKGKGISRGQLLALQEAKQFIDKLYTKKE